MSFRQRRRGASRRMAPQAALGKALWGRRLRGLGVVLVMAGIAAGLHELVQGMLDPRGFPLRHAHIEGELRHLKASEVEGLVGDYLGENFFSLDVAALQAALAAHPWIERVTVRRSWPDSVVVRFRERTAFARWGEKEMVDVNGQRFRPAVIHQPDSWPHLVGPDGHETTLIQVYKEASAMLGQVGLEISRVVHDQRRAWWIELDNGVEISLGREHLMQRLHRLVDVYPQILADRVNQIASIDLRYVNGFAVRWAPSPPGGKRDEGLAGNGKDKGSPKAGLPRRELYEPMPTASAG